MEDEPPPLLLTFKVRRSEAFEEARRRSLPRDIAKRVFPFSVNFKQAPNIDNKVCPRSRERESELIQVMCFRPSTTKTEHKVV